MLSIENSPDNKKNWINPELLDELIREYQTASGLFHNSQTDLLSTDPETIIINLQRANGAGHMLKVIMSRIPKEVINECPIRNHIWNTLFGTYCGGTSSEGRRRSKTQEPSKPSRGSKGTRSIWSRKSSNKPDPNRP